MAWVSRDATGALSGVFANRQPGVANEELPDDNPEVVAFTTPKALDPVDNWDVVSLKILFNHENRIRALEARPAVTLTQFKTFVRSQL